jgi:hypothetical protein
MAKFIIETANGFYRDYIENTFVKDAIDAHVFLDVVDCFDIIQLLRADKVQNIHMIELNPVDDDLIDLARKVVRQAEANAAVNPSSDKIQVVIVEPMKKPYKKTIRNSLDDMKAIVDGWLENVFIGETSSGAKIGCVVNEEGKLIGLPFNRRILARQAIDILAGTFFITAYNLQGDNVTLSDAECERLIRKFAQTEVYL